LPYNEKSFLNYGTDYTVTKLEEHDTGGILTLHIELPPEAQQIVIRRTTPRTQTIDLHDGGRLSAQLIEDMLNKATMQIQEISQQTISRDEEQSIRKDITESIRENEQQVDHEIDSMWEIIKTLTPEGLENLSGDLILETQARIDGDKILQANIETETQIRQQAVNDLQQVDELFQNEINAMHGNGGFLNAYDFGKALDPNDPNDQQLLTDYALSQITSIEDPLLIWNSTRFTNLFDGHTWILTNTQDTDPPIFEWSDNGPSLIKSFSKNMGGFIVGGDPEADGPETVFAQLNGKGKIDLETIKKIMWDMEHHIGDVYIQHPGTRDPNYK
jgi:hypothetical protein